MALTAHRPLPRIFATLVLSAALLSIGLVACGGLSRALPPKAPDPARVEAHSSGLVSASAPVKAVFTASMGSAGQTAPSGVFRFSPRVSGEARWEDERTLVFTPAKALVRGRQYRVDVDMGLLGGQPAGGPDYFSFALRATDQKVDVETLSPRVARDGSFQIEGVLRLADGASESAVEKALKASAGRISWSHDTERVHRFTVSGLARRSGARSVGLSWDAGPLGGRGRGSRTVALPAAGNFTLIGTRVLENGGNGLELAFSDALDKAQDLRGLVSVEGVDELRYSVSGSTLSLYAQAWPASVTVRVAPGLKDAAGRRLAVPAAATVAFQWEKPQVRFLTKGNILPTSQGLVLPVETMNLSGIIVEALRVYGDNMLQFLQVNDLDSSHELKRVGEVVWRKTFDLGWKDDWRNRWMRQGLDLGPLLAAQKEGMFQIRVTFRHDHIRYVSPENHDFKNLRFPDDKVMDRDEGESSFWDYVQEWANGWDDYYTYKDDPDHPAYYLPSYDHDITIRRNVVVSDIGAVLSRETDGTWHAAASDLRSAKPLPGATVTLYSFQRRPLATAITDASGLALLKPAAASGAEPAFATVRLGSQTSWLKVDTGSSLAIGHFDVGGEKADSGLKGFIYGERGVWRPGDAMRLVFILYDRSGRLPEKYPVKFELEDPLGRVVRAATYTESMNGFYAIEAGTSPDAPTGSYTARVEAGGRTFSRSLKVETIMPNRLKINLDWGGSPYLSKDTEQLKLGAAWLTGAQVGALKADVSATFQAAGTSFTTLPDYAFDDPTRQVSGERLLLFDGRLGDDGSASFDVDLSPQGLAPGKLKANVLTRVFEPSGVFSSESTSVDFHPYSRYVGLRLPKGDLARGMLLVDKDQRVDLALVDRDGKLVKGGGEVEVALYQLEWRWWWEKGDESLAQRAQDLYARPLQKDRVKIGPDGRGSWTFQVKYPNWGRFLVRVEDKGGGALGEISDGHAAGSIVYIDWPGWAGRGRDQGGAEAMLELTVGKPKYAPGDRASVSFPSNAEGRALVTLERAGTILKEEWIQTAKDTTLYEFPVTTAMAPNVYAHVTFVQPHLQTANDLPIRLYGVVPIMVEDPSTRLKPLIDAPSSITPGGEVSFSVREASGRPMTYTVAVVDEGLLGITRFKAPDPWDEFYKKEASALQSWDLYQYVAGAFSGKLETLLAVGGSDEALGGGNRKPSRFPAVVYFFGPRTLKAGETRRETFTMGPYIGAVRFMVVAGALPGAALPSSGASVAGTTPVGGGAEAAFGVTEASVPVKADLMTQLTAPRVFSPGESASVPATVFAFMGKKRVAVELRAEGGLALVDEGRKYLDFAQGGDQAATFKVKASTVPGKARLTVTADAEDKHAEQSIDVEVRSVGIPVSAVTSLSLEGGKSWSGTVTLPGAPGTNGVAIELSRLRSMDLAERIDWLVQYPHGCAEQITSAAFPQLYLPKAVLLEAAKAQEAAANVKAAIAKLRTFQTARGGFSLWPGQENEDEWVTAYAAHFLLSARREGFEVPQGLFDPALAYLGRTARSWSSTDAWSQSIQAYRLYDLALAGQADIPAMNRFRDAAELPTAARFRLAATYAMAGMRDAAADLVKDLSSEVEEYPDMTEYTYGTVVRDRAVVLDALLALGDTDRALPVYNEIATALDSRRWYSTQDIGATLAAALPYVVLASKGEATEIRASLAGGAAWSKSLRLDRSVARIDLPAPTGTDVGLNLENGGSAPVIVRLVARGVPLAGAERPASNGITLSLRYLGMDGRTVDPGTLPAGTDFVVETRIRNRSGQDLSNLALTQLLPSGWEIMNYRVGTELPKPSDQEQGTEPQARPEAQAAAAGPSTDFDYQDIRDDRVLTYFSMGAKDTKVFKIYVNRTYEGNFFLPATSVEAMYDGRWQAVVPGRWLSPQSAGGGRDVGVGAGSAK